MNAPAPRFSARRHLLAGAAAVLIGLMAFDTSAADHSIGSLRISGVVAYSTPAAARNGAAYLVIQNRGAAVDRLVSAETTAAGKVELHATFHEGGVMRMRELPAIELPAGGTVRLQRGGMHVMLLGLREPLKAGTSFPLVLVFEKSGRLEVTVTVEPARGGGHHSH